MSGPPIDPARIRAYLLGDTPSEGAVALEDAYFAGEDALDSVAEAEQDLIEDHLAGRLDEAENARFESHYLASAVHRRRVAMTRELLGRARARSRRRMSPILPLAIAAAVLIVAALGVVVIRRPRPEAGRSTPGPAATVVVTLPAVLVRGEGETPMVRVGDGIETVTLRLERGDAAAAPPLQVTVATVEGNEVWKGPADAAAPGQQATEEILAVVTVPAASLAPGDYIVVLSGAPPSGAEIQRYFVRVAGR